VVDAAATADGLNLMLIAEESAGVRALRLLSERGERIAAVLTGSDPSQGATIAALATELGVPCLDSGRAGDSAFAGWIADRQVDLVLNVHSVLNPHEDVLAAPRIGSFNMHPGPLPRYAGFNAPSWAIAQGEERHAVTVHLMIPEMDAGPIAYQTWFEISPRDTGLRVATRCVREGVPLLARLLDDAKRDSIPSRPQAREGGRFYGYEIPYEGRLPWQAGARPVVDLVRAADYAPYPSPWDVFRTRVDGEEIAVVRASRTGEPTDMPPGTIGAPRETGVPVSAGDEWVLVERVRRRGDDAELAVALPAGRRCDSTPPA
jgi:methionyl-tRNA formyltransferase